MEMLLLLLLLLQLRPVLARHPSDGPFYFLSFFLSIFSLLIRMTMQWLPRCRGGGR